MPGIGQPWERIRDLHDLINELKATTDRQQLTSAGLYLDNMVFKNDLRLQESDLENFTLQTVSPTIQGREKVIF